MTNRNGNAYLDGENYRYPLIIKKILSTPLIYSPDREIVSGDRVRYTYRVMRERIRKLAAVLSSQGVKPGDTVAVFDYDSNRYLECFFAVPMMGAVLQTVNWRLSHDQILYTLNHAGAGLVITHTDFLPILEAIGEGLKSVKTVITIRGEPGKDHRVPGHAGEYEELMKLAPASYEFPDLDENTKATTFYTTGTTGDPKGVYFSHRQIVLHTLSVTIASAAYATRARFRSDDVYMPLTPMFHVHAWGFPYVATLLGAKQVYPGKYEYDKIVKLMMRERVTFSHCVPTILRMVLDAPEAKKADFSAWKVNIGGARLPRGLAAEARALGIDIVAGYGMSETCPVMTTAVPHEHMLERDEESLLDVIIKTGKPIPLAEVEVADPGGKILPHDGRSCGEVIMRSPWLTEGYFREPERSRELWRRGWLHSGDVGHIDGEGFLQITDRIKDVIKSGGEWVSSLDLENLMSHHEAVMESAAIGVPHETWGERPLMVVTLKPEYRGKIATDELKAFMGGFAGRGMLPKYGVPELYEFMDQIPKTSVGKIDKKALRQIFSGMNRESR